MSDGAETGATAPELALKAEERDATCGGRCNRSNAARSVALPSKINSGAALGRTLPSNRVDGKFPVQVSDADGGLVSANDRRTPVQPTANRLSSRAEPSCTVGCAWSAACNCEGLNGTCQPPILRTGKYTSTREMTSTGVWSEADPSLASAGRGKAYVDAFVSASVQFIDTWKRLEPMRPK